MNIRDDNDDMLNDDGMLRWQLRGLRHDIEPSRDLWPGIAARIATATPAQTSAPRVAASPRRRAMRWLPAAMAASLLLAAGLFWHQPGIAPPAAAGDALIQREAIALSRHYRGAFAQLPAPAANSDYTPAIRDLDDSAAQILTAIARAPESRFLLERLQRTYARRLALTQRAALT
ncbi:MAG: hypothetical protein QM599_07195 [Pseudoxanthomonas sp.]